MEDYANHMYRLACIDKACYQLVKDLTAQALRRAMKKQRRVDEKLKKLNKDDYEAIARMGIWGRAIDPNNDPRAEINKSMRLQKEKSYWSRLRLEITTARERMGAQPVASPQEIARMMG